MPKAGLDPDHEEILDPEFTSVLRTSDPGLALEGPLTYLPPSVCGAAAWLQAWSTWRDTLLADALAPRLLAVARHAAKGETREITVLDQDFARVLDPAAQARSTATGSRMLARLSKTRGERVLQKLQRSAAAGESPAHFATVYAVQSVLFHLPMRLLLPGCAYWEWTGAMLGRPPLGQAAPRFTGEILSLRLLAERSLAAASSAHAAHPFQPAAAHAS